MNLENRKVRVRFAPSPTGPLHIGGVRTALFNYLFAKQHNGDMVLRIEDTDSQRFVPGAEDYIIEALKWLKIEVDEGVGVSDAGIYAPYRQSERRDIYRKYVKQLLDQDKAYYAFDTPEDLERYRSERNNFQYDASTRMGLNNSLSMTKEELERRLESGEQYVVRLKIDGGEDVHVQDMIRGEVVINSSILDDKVLYKSTDDLPTYHLANVVDDHLMEITHVIRGEEWLPSSPLHVLLYRALGWQDSMPQFAHLPLLLKPEGNGKLSKRDGDRLGFPVFPLEWKDPQSGKISTGYRECGYLSEAVINFLALLGWSSGTEEEIFSMSDLVRHFDINKCSKSGAKFDYEKGKWFNHKYIQAKSSDQLITLSSSFLKKAGIVASEDKLSECINLIKDRLTLLSDLPDMIDYFFIAPTTYDEKAISKRWKEETPVQLSDVLELFEKIPKEDWIASNLEDRVKSLIKEKSYNMGGVLNPLRLSIVGALKGPHLFDIISFLGKTETIERLTRALHTISID